MEIEDKQWQSELCINCLLCVHVCPLLNNPIAISSNYPNSLVNLDRDLSELEHIDDIDYFCLICTECKIVCPRNLDPTKAIMEVRKRKTRKSAIKV